MVKIGFLALMVLVAVSSSQLNQAQPLDNGAQLSLRPHQDCQSTSGNELQMMAQKAHHRRLNTILNMIWASLRRMFVQHAWSCLGTIGHNNPLVFAASPQNRPTNTKHLCTIAEAAEFL